MALLKFLGAESAALQELYSYQANILVDTTVSANSGGARSYKADGSQTSNTSLFYDLGGLSGLYVALRWRATFSGAPAADRAYRLGTVSTSGGTGLGFCNIQHLTTGVWRIYLGDNATGTVQGTPYEWNYVSGDWVDIQFYINKDGGWIKINGASVYTLNATNILWTTGTIDRIAGLSFTASDTARPMWIDDYCVADADMGRNPSVIARQFAGNSATYNAWSAVGGANKYSNVSETPFSATNAINNAGTTAAAQTFTLNSFSSSETGKGSGTIGATSTFLGAKLGAVLKTSSATQGGSGMSLRRRISGVDTDVAFTITTGDVYYDTCAKAGASNFAFTPSLANLNGGEYGVVHGVTSLSRTQTCEDLWVHAAYIAPQTYIRSVALTASGAFSG